MRVGIPAAGLLRYVAWAAAWVARQLVLGYALIAFNYKVWAKYMPVFGALHHFVPLGCVAVLAAGALLPRSRTEKALRQADDKAKSE